MGIVNSCRRRLGCARCPISGEIGSCPFSVQQLAGKGASKEPLLGGSPSKETKSKADAAKKLSKVDKLLRRGSELALNHSYVYAEMSFAKAIELDAKDWRGYSGKALALHGQGRHEAALACCLEGSEHAAKGAERLQPLKELMQTLTKDTAQVVQQEPKEKHGKEEQSDVAVATAANPEDESVTKTSAGRSKEAAKAAESEPTEAAEGELTKAAVSVPRNDDVQPAASIVGPPCPGAADTDSSGDIIAKTEAAESGKRSFPWEGQTISEQDRQVSKDLMLSVFREQWERLGQAKKGFDDYTSEQKMGLKISGGHRPLPRPDDIVLPKDHHADVGILSAQQLEAYNCENERLLLSLHGDIFDVSDRPDKYGKDGPYHYLTGHDITWGLVSGQDSEETVNYFYDLFKSEESERQRKLQCICSWIAFYETEYGKPVGRLAEYNAESELPPPPATGEQCVVQ